MKKSRKFFICLSFGVLLGYLTSAMFNFVVLSYMVYALWANKGTEIYNYLKNIEFTSYSNRYHQKRIQYESDLASYNSGRSNYQPTPPPHEHDDES